MLFEADNISVSQMFKLKKLLNENIDISSINLDFENIRDLTLSMSTLKKFPFLKSLSLHGNQLSKLPLMTNLQLTHLDISRNPLQIDSYLLDSLYSCATLEHLKIDGSAKDLQRIVQNLPTLKTLNENKILRQRNKDIHKDIFFKMRNNLNLEKQKIIKLSKECFEKFEVKEDQEDFDRSFEQILLEYKEFSENVMNDNAKEGIYIYSKNRILDLAMESYILALQTNGFQHIADSLLLIDQLRKQYFDSLLKIVLQVGYDEICLEDDLGEELDNQMKNLKLRKQRLYLKEIMRLKKKVYEYRAILNRTEEENKKYMQMLYSLTKGEVEKIMGEEIVKVAEPKAIDLISEKKNTKKDVTPKSMISHSKSSKKLNNVQNQDYSNIRKNEQKKEEIEEKSSILSKDQTMGLMDEIIGNKQLHNESCVRKKLAFETTQEFLSIFFTKKYGGKALAANWSVKFIRSVNFYSKSDSVCEVFLKILKNNLEESFYEEHKTFLAILEKQLQEYNSGQKISYGETEIIFKRLLPSEEIDQMRNIEDLSEITPEALSLALRKSHIKIHEELLREFLALFRQYDVSQSGIMTLSQARQFVIAFFEPKIQKLLIQKSIPEKVIQKLDPFKKNRVIFSELVDIVDKI